MTDGLPAQIVPFPAQHAGNGNGRQPPDITVTAPPPPAFPMTDQGLAERLHYWHGEDILFCRTWNKFLHWTGTQYTIDTSDEMSRRSVDTIRKIRTIEAVYEPSPERQNELRKFSLRSESDSRIAAMLNRVKGLVPVSPSLFDAQPMLLNYPNGTLDLTTFEFREHRRADRLTKCVTVPYIPGATCPSWTRFLLRVLDGNEILIAFIQRVVGYLLTGLTIEEVLFFLFGTGRNGKSVFIGIIQWLLGDYARSTRPETLMVKPGHDIPNDIAALAGARFVATVEIDEGARLAESLVKQLTGGDMVTARFLYGEPFDFKPTFKIMMAGNHKPVIKGTDLAIWERILTIPFTVTIPAEERDKHLRQKLMAEGPGIMAWAIEGCGLWQEQGLNPPPEVRAATDEYRSEMDIISQFIEDCCVVQHTAVTTAGELYDRYAEWCKDTGERAMGQNAFGRKMTERGFDKTKFKKIRAWEGIGLRHEGDGGDAF